MVKAKAKTLDFHAVFKDTWPTPRLRTNILADLHVQPQILANRYMSSSVRLFVVCRLSVCNVRAPYSCDWNFRQFFYVLGTLAIH